MLIRSLSLGVFLVLNIALGLSSAHGGILLKQVFHTLEKELDFFGEDYSSINVDGLFGLRLGHGQLKSAIEECLLTPKSCDFRDFARLQKLEGRLQEISDAALPYVKAADEAYFQRFESTISRPYILPYTPTSFEEDDVTTGSETNYDEEAGDSCYSRMMGTYLENNRVLPKCNITSDCLDMMIRDDTAAYFITHQLLYFIIIEHMDCRENVEDFIKDRKMFDIQKNFCRKIYEESKQLEKDGHVASKRRDLFLEQTVLCASLGFEDFLRADWIKMVLSWPDKEDGCFKSNIFEELVSKSLSRNRRTMRKLMRESPMKGGCLSHTSGLGFGTFSTYLRYLLKNDM